MDDQAWVEYFRYTDLLSLLSNVALILFARFVMGFKPRRVLMGITGSILCIAFILSGFFPDWFGGISILIVIPLFILIYVSFRKLKIRYLLFVNIFTQTISLLVCSLIGNSLYSLPVYVEPLSQVVVMAIFCVLFLSKFRYALQDLLLATPRWAINSCSIVCLVIFSINTIFLSTSILGLTVHHYAYIDEFIAVFQSVQSVDIENLPKVVVDAYNIIQLWPLVIVSILILEFVLIFAFLVYVFTVRAKNNLKLQNENFEKQIAAQAEHYRELAAANAEVRRFKHDFKNVRFAIEQLLSDGKKQEALTVMQEFTEALNTNSRTMILFDTGNGIADALLTDKLRQAHQKQTLLTFKGAIPQNALAPTDLCVLLGNTIDNAIEACEKLPPEFQREISVECNCSCGFLFLTVRNPVEKPVPICDNRVPSTKKDKALHGFGIQSLHKVAKNYDGLVKLNSDDGFFTVNIDLCLPVMDMTMAG